MKRSTGFLLLAAVGIAGYYAYRLYRQKQIASAHPIIAPNDATLIKPLPFNASLVSDAQLAV